MIFIGIDLGTSGVKAMLIEAGGSAGGGERMIGVADAPLTASRPHPGWSEQNPDDWIAAALAAMDGLAAAHPAEVAACVGIGLSGQMHGATLLDAADKPLRPAILWNDGRAGAEGAALEARADFRRVAGNQAMPGFTAPKVEWVRTHQPDIYAKIAKVLLPKDYLRLHLTGGHVSDMSDSSGTLWLDVAARDWSDDLLTASGLSRDHMPALVEGSDPSGDLRADLCARWGMTRPPVVAGGGGDNAASACGVGALAPGGAFVSLGTSGVLFVANARFSPNTAGAVHAMCHAAPGLWHQMGVILSAADGLEWLSGITGASAAEMVGELESDPDALSEPSEIAFLPYLSGERTPHSDPGARGAFIGLARASERRHLTRAVLEGVAFAFRDCRDALGAAGTDFDVATAVGGGARSRLWLRIIAAAMDRPVAVPLAGEFGAAFGAARLGICAAAGADPLAVCTPPEIAETIDPDPALRDAYAAAMPRWRALYPALKELRQ